MKLICMTMKLPICWYHYLITFFICLHVQPTLFFFLKVTNKKQIPSSMSSWLLRLTTLQMHKNSQRYRYTAPQPSELLTELAGSLYKTEHPPSNPTCSQSACLYWCTTLMLQQHVELYWFHKPVCIYIYMLFSKVNDVCPCQ